MTAIRYHPPNMSQAPIQQCQSNRYLFCFNISLLDRINQYKPFMATLSQIGRDILYYESIAEILTLSKYQVTTGPPLIL